MKNSNYPLNHPSNNYPIDVVVPYCESDRHLVLEAIETITLQKYCSPIIHAVADNCEPIKHELCSHYFTKESIGPFWIVNSLVSRFTTQYIAIQDADDLSYTNRLWKQISLLNMGYYMTSCAMIQIPIEGYDGSSHKIEPIIFPGLTKKATPWGRNVNGTRTMLRSFFIEMNGFGDYPLYGDYQFDSRACSLYPDFCHYSNEVLAIRRLRPESLSHRNSTGFTSEIRNEISCRVRQSSSTMKRDTTLSVAQSLGYLDKTTQGLVTQIK